MHLYHTWLAPCRQAGSVWAPAPQAPVEVVGELRPVDGLGGEGLTSHQGRVALAGELGQLWLEIRELLVEAVGELQLVDRLYDEGLAGGA